MASHDRLTAELARLRAGAHAHPHELLGPHGSPADDSLVVRAYRPEARSIRWLPDGGEARDMVALGGGVFELTLPGRTSAGRYRLEIAYADGKRFTIDDPYRFAPTISEQDLYLFNEGSQERAWEHLGAHVRVLDGVTGTAFTVWAPAAAAVSVVGDFDGWDGRLHPMRQLGASGVWELFVPGVEDGALYKLELRTQGGARVLKAILTPRRRNARPAPRRWCSPRATPSPTRRG